MDKTREGYNQPTDEMTPPTERVFMAIGEIQISNLTLWDYFAAAALSGLVADLDMNISDTQIAEYSANFADAMLEERKKRMGE